MTIVALFLLNAGLSFALSLVVAALLGPAGFGRYAVALSGAIVVNTICFEWLRLATTRFYSERVRTHDPGVRVVLGRAYAVTTGGLALATLLLWGTGVDLGLSGGLLAASAAAGVTLGLFDWHAALARSRFHDRSYATLVLVRGVGSFGLAAAAAWLSRDPALVLWGSAAAGLAALALARRPLADPTTRGIGRRRGLLVTFARYGLPLVAASALYQILPVANRAVLAGREGFVEAGYFSLASEIGTRLFQNVGSALDLVLFQIAVRADEQRGREAGQEQVARNIGTVAAVLAPAAVGLLLVLPSFETVFVPSDFRGQFAPAMTFLVPSLAAFALIQYALNPVFQLRGRTGPVVAAAMAGLALDLGLVLFWPGLSGSAGVAAAQLAALLGALAVLTGLALAAGARLPWGEFARVGLATGAMAAALVPFLGWAPTAATLGAQVGVGATAYGIAAVALDLVGMRAVVAARLGRTFEATTRRHST